MGRLTMYPILRAGATTRRTKRPLGAGRSAAWDGAERGFFFFIVRTPADSQAAGALHTAAESGPRRRTRDKTLPFIVVVGTAQAACIQ